MFKKDQNDSGINNKCSCGIVKQFKNCYFPHILGLSSSELPKTDLGSLKIEFKKYSKKELIGTLAGLHLFPENQSHTVRLEVALRIACSFRESGEEKINSNKLLDTINKYIPTLGDIGKLEDPPESLFTENVLFHGGNYVIYEGKTLDEKLVLSTLFATIEASRNLFPYNFVNEVEICSIALLVMSNEIAKRMGHTRYMDSPDTWEKDFVLLDEKQIEKARSAVTFTKKEIDDLFVGYGFNNEVLKPFISPLIDSKSIDPDSEKNPHILKPLIEIDNTIIVSLPGSIAYSLHHFIISNSKKYSVKSVLHEKYTEILHEYVDNFLMNLQFSKLDLDLPSWEGDLRVKESVFSIDSNKLAYVQLIVVASDSSSETKFKKHRTQDKLTKKISSRDKRVIKWLSEKYNFDQKNILIIKILNSIKGSYICKFKNNKDCLALAISIGDLEVISNSRHQDSLIFWKFAKAEKNVTFISPFTSFLDKFYFYLESDYSLNLNNKELDKIERSLVALKPGTGIDFKLNVLRKMDSHGALAGNPPKYLSVVRVYDDNKVPIYIPECDLRGVSYQLIEGYNQPIWIGTKNSFENTNKIPYICSSFVGSLAYWIWLITPALRPHLSPLGILPITIHFYFEDQDKWVKLGNEECKSKSTVDLKWKLREYDIDLSIPANVQLLLQRPDNLFDRLMIDALLKAFGDMLGSNGFSNSLGASERNTILDTYVPLGHKRMMVAVNSATSASLDGNNIPTLRLAQKHDISEQIHWLAEKLSENSLMPKDIRTKSQKTKFCNLVVDLYCEKLKSIISSFHWRELLEVLIAYNESICHQREMMYFTAPTSIACFCDISSKVNQDLEFVNDFDPSAIALRLLIEIVSAEPPNGNQEMSIEDYDTLLAVSYEIIDWANISEFIHNEIIDHEIITLKSGQVIPKRTDSQDNFNSFKRSKMLERYESAILRFENYFEDIENEDNEKYEINDTISELENAYKAEFGFSGSQISQFIACLIDIGLEQNCAIASFYLSDLKMRIKVRINWSDTEIENAINLFSLKKRDLWEEPPEGFDKNDIKPWKYNRRLSYLRKPLILGDEPQEDPLVLWGPRHVEESAKHLFDLISSGRYKIDYKETSREMKKLIGSINDVSGKNFTIAVKNWLAHNTNWIIDSEIPIRPKERLKSDYDLGDIDVLGIDERNNRIFLIECKCLNCGRNPHEIINEIERLFGKSTQEKSSLIKKHLKRDEWARNNIDKIIKEYKLENKIYQVSSLFLISDDIPARYIRKMPLLFVSFYQLTKEGTKVFDFVPNEEH